MNTHQITLVEDSFALVLPIVDVAAALFYERLFELDPTLRRMFPSDLKDQGRKLMTMINVAVNSLRRLETIVPAVQALGRRHVHYGVKDEHYAVVGSALLWTLRQGLGDRFTAETEQAWTEVYTTLASVMQAAAATEAVHLPIMNAAAIASRV